MRIGIVASSLLLPISIAALIVHHSGDRRTPEQTPNDPVNLNNLIDNAPTTLTPQRHLAKSLDPADAHAAKPFENFPFGKLQQDGQGGQDFFRRRSRGGFRSAPDRSEYATWEIESQFKDDVFTFVRIQYDSYGGSRRGRDWDNDYPDCDWNFSVRLHELTSIEVDPNGKVIRLTDDELFDHPFIFFSNINRMDLSEAEVTNLRKYLLKGGFMMADDFWAPQSWEHVYREMKRVFPELEPRELTRDHEIFHLVYDIKGLPQVPSIHAWNQGHTFEYWHGDPQGDEGPHFWGFFDSNDRLMALLCHNNDVADGWEREGENKEYFTMYSERVSYPLGINIVTYAMTH